MKNYGFNININKNSNAVIGHTEANWHTLKKNSLINIGNDAHFYTIGKVDPLNFISDFVVEDNNLLINGEYENYFLADDVVIISYKEYELLTIKNITNKGIGYKIGDILNFTGGELSINVIDNKSHPTLLKVEEIGNAGCINKLSIFQRGVYLKFPNKLNTLNGGSGSGAEIDTESNIITNRKMIERQVIRAESRNNQTLVQINYPLPSPIKEGKLSFNKHIAYLTSNYVGEDSRNTEYHILRDSTPHLGLPILLKNSNKSTEYYNHTIQLLDKEIKDLKNRLDKLEKR